MKRINNSRYILYWVAYKTIIISSTGRIIPASTKSIQVHDCGQQTIKG